jgi:hypothetical protein
MDILPFDIAFFAASIVLIAVLLVVRRRMKSPGWRDFLGITATFIVLVGIGFLMILGEHELG